MHRSRDQHIPGQLTNVEEIESKMELAPTTDQYTPAPPSLAAYPADSATVDHTGYQPANPIDQGYLLRLIVSSGG